MDVRPRIPGIVVVTPSPFVHVDDAILEDIGHPLNELRDVVTEPIEIGDDLFERRPLEV